jgi:hypothetical protein
MRVKVVSAFVPLEVRHLSAAEYRAYGSRMQAALGDDLTIFEHPITDCWLHGWLTDRGLYDLKPATDVPSDRYASPAHMVASNIVQHQRTQWLVRAACNILEEPEVFVWLDLAILKQGHFTGKPVQERHIIDFVNRIKSATFDDIPFPGIWPKGPIADFGANWRFCGSTHIIPRKHLFLVDEFYRYECRKFIERTKTIPLDLPIWALTEQNSTLPFRQYAANHDATQLTEFPYGPRPDAPV